jgi:hypothetical protein
MTIETFEMILIISSSFGFPFMLAPNWKKDKLDKIIYRLVVIILLQLLCYEIWTIIKAVFWLY